MKVWDGSWKCMGLVHGCMVHGFAKKNNFFCEIDFINFFIPFRTYISSFGYFRKLQNLKKNCRLNNCRLNNCLATVRVHGAYISMVRKNLL